MTLMKFPSVQEKPFFVSLKSNHGVKKSDCLTIAPYSVKVLVLKVYKDNFIKRFLRKFRIKLRFNELKVIKTNIKTRNYGHG